MKEDLLKIINHYGIEKQLKYFQSEVFELNEAIIKMNNTNHFGNASYYQEDIEHIAEEIADVRVMLRQFQEYYNIPFEEIENIMNYKVKRQLERIKEEKGE